MRASGPFHRSATRGPRRQALALACSLLALSPALQAQSQDRAAAARSGRVQPTLELAESYVYGNAIDGRDQGEFVTRISPGLRWSSRAGRVQGNVDYSLDALHYSRRRGEDAVNQRLNANISAELLPQHAFVDVRANIGRQPVSAYGPQFVGSDITGNPNRTSVATLQVSPYVQGRLGGVADLQVRLTAASTDAKDYAAANSRSTTALVSLASVGSGLLGWNLSAQRQDVSFRQGSDTVSDRIAATVTWRPDIDWRFFLRGGRESTDLGTVVKRQYDNVGGGLAWTPSPRTNVALEADKRYFGTGYRGLVEYRTARTVLRYIDSRDTTSGGDLNFNNQPVTLFQLFFQQFAPSFPDPVAREQAVNDFLRLIGRNGNELISVGALADAVSLQRRQELSAVWNGRRLVLTVQGYASDLRAIDRGLGVTLISPLPERTRQRGLILGASYRLDPLTTLSLNASRQSTPGSGTLAGNRLDALSAGVNSQFSDRLNWGFNLRLSDFSGGGSPYQEVAATASLNLRF